MNHDHARHLTCGLVLLSLAMSLPAQPKRERRTFAHLMNLRQLLWHECRDASDEVKAAVAEALAQRDGNPITPVANGLARARGVAADAAFVYRATLQCFALPEVVDGSAYTSVAMTVHLPYQVEVPGVATFVLRILDAEGAERWQGKVENATDVEDLLRFSGATTAFVDDFADGEYRVEVTALLDGETPRPHDPVTTTTFHVQRNFVRRVQTLVRDYEVLAQREDVDLAELRLVPGAMAQVRRAWEGEPAVGASRAPLELAQAETMVRNVAAGKPALAGLTGWVTITLDVPDSQAAIASVRLPPDDVTAGPLIVVIPGAPALDARWTRPTSPRATEPGWHRDAIDAAGCEFAGVIAILESPGRLPGGPATLSATIDRLRALFPGRRSVLIGEREGATAITTLLMRDARVADAVALISGGALGGPAVAELAEVEFCVIAAHGHPANQNLLRARDLLAAEGAKVHELPGAKCPWAIALWMTLPELAAWIDDVLNE